MPLSVRVARLTLAAALLAAGLGACRNAPTRPESLADAYGVYVLDLPAEALAGGHTDTLFLTSRLASDGPPDVALLKITGVTLRAGAPPGSTPDSAFAHTCERRVDARDGEVYPYDRCTDAAVPCDGRWLFRGPLEGDRLTLHPRMEMSISTRFYRRVWP